jgi:hypothetical protein
MDEYAHFFLTSALVRGDWSVLRPCYSPDGERTKGTRRIGGWVDPTAGLDNMEKRTFFTLSRLKLRLYGRPARNQSLHGLRYRGSDCLY